MLKRVYWVQLKKLIVKLCRFHMKWKRKYPTDLPEAVLIALDAIEIACTAILDYDDSHVRGQTT